MIIDQKNFFSNYRNAFGRIYKDETVATIYGMLNEGQSRGISIPQLAYLFATAYHEAKDKKYFNDFYPIRERGSNAYKIRLYWENSRVRRWLGNRISSDSILYDGKGLAQITGYDNYKKFGIADNPMKALEIKTAIQILFDGVLKGMFTGVKLSYYLNDSRKAYVSARRTVNGLDKAELIASYAVKFEDILCRSIVSK